MIRPYAAKDKPETIALLRQNTPAYFDPSEEADFNHYLDVEREDYFVYEEEGRIVAVVFATPGSAGKAKLHQLYILPAYQGRGLGRQLLDAVEDALTGAIVLELEVEEANVKARRFYARNGFVQTGMTSDCGVRDSGIPALIYTKPIG